MINNLKTKINGWPTFKDTHLPKLSGLQNENSETLVQYPTFRGHIPLARGLMRITF